MSRLDKVLMIVGTIVTPLTYLAGIIHELYAIQSFEESDIKGFAFFFFCGLWFFYWGDQTYKNARDYWRRFLDERKDC